MENEDLSEEKREGKNVDIDEESKEMDETPFTRSSQLGLKVMAILQRNDSDVSEEDMHFRPKLFTQLDILCHLHPEATIGWKEMSRWLKYEEKVDAGGRWSKPHVSTISFRGLSHLRCALSENKCVLALDISAASKTSLEVYQLLVNEIAKTHGLDDCSVSKILDVLQRPHKHKHRKAVKKPLIQSNRDGRPVFRTRQKRAPSMTTARRKSLVRREGKDLWSIYTAYPKGVTPDDLKPYKPNKKIMKKLPAETESASILVGILDFLNEPIFAFCRLEPPVTLDDTCEVSFPTRFVFLVFGTTSNSLWEMSEIGRAAALLFNDKIFSEVAYSAQGLQDLLCGVDEFIDSLTILPPSIWDPTTRLDPPMHTINTETIAERLTEFGRSSAKIEPPGIFESAGDDKSLYRTGRVFGGLCADVRQRYRHYKSDITDGFNIQCVASAVFLYFACITPIVTFGGLMEKKTNGFMGTIEMLLSGAVCGLVYALFSGQPLTIVGATGPLLVFEGIVYDICEKNELDFMSFRFWIGMWIFLYLLLIVVFDLSSFVRYITRFTEECFAVLISFIFIYEALIQLFEVWKHNPVHINAKYEPPDFACFCVEDSSESFRNDTTNVGKLSFVNDTAWFLAENRSLFLKESCLTVSQKIEVRHGCITTETCRDYHWSTAGNGCKSVVTDSVPDVFLLSCVLLFGTFAVAIFFRNLRTTRYFPQQVRTTLGDFAVFLSVVLWTALDAIFGLNTAKLNVPATFKTTIGDRGWIVNPFETTYWWLIPMAAIPGILATVLIFLDQQITAVIVNRKEHKLVKGHGYHLDLFVLANLVAICSTLGLPWFCAATVRSISHVQSLVRESEVRAPGEKSIMLGVREQRLTGITIHALIGLSMLCAPVLQYIPMPVLYGVFLYMGITSLTGVQFIERIMIIFMPVKYQPDYIYIRHVRTSRVHIFTFIQILCSGLMWMIKSIKETSMAFPIMLLALMATRKGMDYIFTQRELYWLDHLLPDEHRRKREDILKALEKATKT